MVRIPRRMAAFYFLSSCACRYPVNSRPECETLRAYRHVLVVLVGGDVPCVVCFALDNSLILRYGKWGYDFGRSTYNWSREQYLASLDAVHYAPLQDIILDLQGVDEVRWILGQLISCFTSLI